MRALTCAGCGAPLTLGDDPSSTVVCAYCEREHIPFALESSTDDPRAVFVVGDLVYAQWGERWWPAVIKRVVAEDVWEVHYEGWSEKWDEVLDVTRVRARGGALPGAGGSRRGVGLYLLLGLAAIVVGVFIATTWALGSMGAPAEDQESVTRRGPIRPTGIAMPDGLRLSPGMAVEVEWNESFYRGTVLEDFGNGSLRVHYVGWSDSFDEPVDVERVRIGQETLLAARGPVPASALGAPLDADSAVFPGDVILVEWREDHYRAVIDRVHEDGRLRVHYAGWEESWDEDIPRSRGRRETAN